MADVTKNGIIVSPSSGSGNTELKVKAQRANQGNRTIQTATYTVQPQGGTSKTLIWKQLMSLLNSQMVLLRQ